MAKLLKRHWSSDLASGMSRRDRRSCDYSAYLPDPLDGRVFALAGDVVADVTDAEAAIARLNAGAGVLTNSEAIARLLLRAESVASSRIEGLEVGARRLLRAEAASDLGEAPSDVTATEVLGNIEAMRQALDAVDDGSAISVDLVLAMHERLLRGTRLQEYGGKVRTDQNWIGGSQHNPCSASFVPPPPEHVDDLLDDLCRFCNTDDLPAVVQAAMAHAQFETIHPFVDGNGRTGRGLIHLILRRRGLAPKIVPPVSLILATWAKDYVDGLTATRYVGAPTSPGAHAGINEWVARFAAACTRAVSDAEAFEETARDLEQSWRQRLAPIRASSAVDLLVSALPGAPILTTSSAAALIQRTFPAANGAVRRLVEAGVLRQVNVGRRNRAFEAPEVIDAFTDLERRLASPTGDTRQLPPRRRVPARPAR
ncbi:MAG: filamentation induced by cAMP protein Fic [Frankiales bacterium]|nr:filamentation induced by cAMP protein Fic [Frankiales bacterium]